MDRHHYLCDLVTGVCSLLINLPLLPEKTQQHGQGKREKKYEINQVEKNI
jgi:hypothetical protein